MEITRSAIAFDEIDQMENGSSNEPFGSTVLATPARPPTYAYSPFRTQVADMTAMLEL